MHGWCQASQVPRCKDSTPTLAVAWRIFSRSSDISSMMRSNITSGSSNCSVKFDTYARTIRAKRENMFASTTTALARLARTVPARLDAGAAAMGRAICFPRKLGDTYRPENRCSCCFLYHIHIVCTDAHDLGGSHAQEALHLSTIHACKRQLVSIRLRDNRSTRWNRTYGVSPEINTPWLGKQKSSSGLEPY